MTCTRRPWPGQLATPFLPWRAAWFSCRAAIWRERKPSAKQRLTVKMRDRRRTWPTAYFGCCWLRAALRDHGLSKPEHRRDSIALDRAAGGLLAELRTGFSRQVLSPLRRAG